MAESRRDLREDIQSLATELDNAATELAEAARREPTVRAAPAVAAAQAYWGCANRLRMILTATEEADRHA